MRRIAASSREITIPQPGVALSEQVIQRGGRMHDEQLTLRIGGQQHAVTRDQPTAMPDSGGQTKMPLLGHPEHTVRIGADHEKPSGLADIQASTGHPAQRTHHGVIGHAAPAVHCRKPIHGATPPPHRQSRQRKRPAGG